MGTSSPLSPAENEWDAERVRDWVVANAKPLAFGIGIVVVAGAGFAFWRQSVQLKNDRANTAFATAQGAYYSGNTALAKSDLEKLVTRYPGTQGATQAGMLLAQLLYGESKHDDAIKTLTSLQGGAPSQFAASLEELIAAGYADSNRPALAAEHLLKAAGKARFTADQQLYRADAARFLSAAGKTDEARKIWAELADIPDSPASTEARIRMGELSAKEATP